MASAVFTGFGQPSSYLPSPAASAKTKEEEDADATWAAQGQKTLADQTSAGKNASTYQSGADKALSDYNAIKPTNTAAWSPTATAGYAPSQVAQWMASLGNLSAASGAPAAAASVGSVGAVSGGKPGAGTALGAYDDSALAGFDPSAAGSTFAKGAYGDFEQNLNKDLTTLTNKAVGQGRFNTGFFDTDQGSVVKSNAKTFDDALAQQAGVFSGQRLSALQGDASNRLSAAQGIDANDIARTGQANALATANADRALKSNEDTNSFNLSKYGLGLQGAEYGDTSTYNRDRALDTDTYARATYLDNNALSRGQTGLEAALQREQEYNNLNTTATSNANSFASANRDWAAQDRATADARDAAARAAAIKGGGPPLQQTPFDYTSNPRRY